MLRVDDLCRFYALCIIVSWHPGFGPKCALPIDRKAGVIGIGSVIDLPFMPSWLCNVRRKATEDWLTALKCQPVGTDGTIKGSPSPALASQHQNFISGTEPICFFSYGKELFFSNAFFVPMATRSGILYCQAQYHSGKFCAKPY